MLDVSIRKTPTVAFVVLALGFFLVEHPQAYIDPGSASYLFQVLVGGLLGGAFVLRTYWTRVKGALERVFGPERVGE